MTRAVLFILFATITSYAQVRVSKLVINPGEVYELGESDIIVADTLIMMDSSRIKLNQLKRENYIRAKVAIFGNHTIIDGRGVSGKPGRNGKPGRTFIGPCRAGSDGAHGTRGLEGTPGINLFLYIDKINITGRLIIDLSGGHGGNGGDGGEGGGGSPGTLQCDGGNGGNGGSGAIGGNGGVGGTLTIGGSDLAIIKTLIGNKLTLYNKGGNFGYGGISGFGGPPGLGPAKKNGRAGVRGIDGPYGRSGNNGSVKFEEQ
ncbi:MAG: hypothetical protein ACOYXT_21105 [Bacteroidota bacterium]